RPAFPPCQAERVPNPPAPPDPKLSPPRASATMKPNPTPTPADESDDDRQALRPGDAARALAVLFLRLGAADHPLGRPHPARRLGAALPRLERGAVSPPLRPARAARDRRLGLVGLAVADRDPRPVRAVVPAARLQGGGGAGLRRRRAAVPRGRT